MKKFLLRLMIPTLMAILEPALRDALKGDVKVPDDQRKRLSKLGFDDAKIDAIDARVQKQVTDRVMREVERSVNKAAK